MDAHKAKPIVAVAAILAVVSLPAFANPVFTYRADFDLPIPANPDDTQGWMNDAVINVTDDIRIVDLDVRINLTHASLFDLQILLQSPAGTNVALSEAGNLAFIVEGPDGRLTSVGGSGEMLFDDEAEVSIEQAAEPFFGHYRPAWSLSSFDNENAYGPWRLKIYDSFPPDTGTLHSAELIITVPEPATIIILILSAAFLRFCKPRRSAAS